MTMRYRIRHETLYAYADRVDLAAHMLHLSPRMLPGQQVFDASITAEPRPSRMSWGRQPGVLAVSGPSA